MKNTAAHTVIKLSNFEKGRKRSNLKVGNGGTFWSDLIHELAAWEVIFLQQMKETLYCGQLNRLRTTEIGWITGKTPKPVRDLVTENLTRLKGVWGCYRNVEQKNERKHRKGQTYKGRKNDLKLEEKASMHSERNMRCNTEHWIQLDSILFIPEQICFRASRLFCFGVAVVTPLVTDYFTSDNIN